LAEGASEQAASIEETSKIVKTIDEIAYQRRVTTISRTTPVPANAGTGFSRVTDPQQAPGIEPHRNSITPCEPEAFLSWVLRPKYKLIGRF
jgi:hypothetical protein